MVGPNFVTILYWISDKYRTPYRPLEGNDTFLS
jgi:hypothetical protein